MLHLVGRLAKSGPGGWRIEVEGKDSEVLACGFSPL